MDPYLENPADWPDFHHRFLNDLCDAIFGRLPDHYEARIEERVNLAATEEAEAEFQRLIEPDVAVERRGGAAPAGAAPDAAGGLALAPVIVPLRIVDPYTENFIRILHGGDRTLVTVVELLSPFKKRGEGRGEYLAKRDALLHTPVHLVEVDLLAGGRRPPMRGNLPPGHYYTFVSRGDRRPDCEVYAWTVRDPLPTIPVPLRAPDPDVLLPLAEVFAVTYRRGRYGWSVNYAAVPQSPLDPPSREWAAGRGKPAE